MPEHPKDLLTSHMHRDASSTVGAKGVCKMAGLRELQHDERPVHCVPSRLMGEWLLGRVKQARAAAQGPQERQPAGGQALAREGGGLQSVAGYARLHCGLLCVGHQPQVGTDALSPAEICLGDPARSASPFSFQMEPLFGRLTLGVAVAGLLQLQRTATKGQLFDRQHCQWGWGCAAQTIGHALSRMCSCTGGWRQRCWRGRGTTAQRTCILSASSCGSS